MRYLLLTLLLLMMHFGYGQQSLLGRTMDVVKETNAGCALLNNKAHKLMYSCDGYQEQYFFNEKDVLEMVEVDISANRAVAIMDTLMQTGFRKKESSELKIYTTPEYMYVFMPNPMDLKEKDRVAVLMYPNTGRP